MDIYDYLFKIKNQYYLGNYQQVFTLWKQLEKDVDYDSPEFASTKTQYIELLVLTHKTMLHFLNSDQDTVKENQDMLERFKDSMNLYLTYFGKDSDELESEGLEKVLEELNQFPVESDQQFLTELMVLSKKVIQNYLCFRVKKFDLFVSIDGKYPETLMDLRMLKFQAFSFNNQFKEANNLYEVMKTSNDEHILINFCQFEIENRFQRNHEEAMSVLLEMMQKFGESPKIINLNISSLILNRNFFKVIIYDYILN